ncbi:MAG TPA: SPOR domain-containing protein [Vicinamibacterales bacterium]|nr:SPOR domain-containing protein [Vicinamibacterales bacterium]
MNDEGFREIQLNGKQLIFLFMAVTVVLVVTFLFGVLVGRGVREGAGTPQIATGDVTPDADVAPAADNPAPPAAGGASPQAPAAPPAEELSYAERLLRDAPPEETLKPTPSEPAAPAPVVQEPVADRAPAPVEEKAQPTSVPTMAAAAQATDPTGPGFAVQVAAYPDRRDAETLVKQLVTKGYPAFVMDPVKGAPTKLFRVRVGKYPTRTVAEGVQARLVKSEQFTNAWIAR